MGKEGDHSGGFCSVINFFAPCGYLDNEGARYCRLTLFRWSGQGSEKGGPRRRWLNLHYYAEERFVQAHSRTIVKKATIPAQKRTCADLLFVPDVMTLKQVWDRMRIIPQQSKKNGPALFLEFFLKSLILFIPTRPGGNQGKAVGLRSF